MEAGKIMVELQEPIQEVEAGVEHTVKLGAGVLMELLLLELHSAAPLVSTSAHPAACSARMQGGGASIPVTGRPAPTAP